MLLIRLAFELPVDDLLSVRDCVVVAFEGSERGKDLVVDSFNKHHFFKGIKSISYLLRIVYSRSSQFMLLLEVVDEFGFQTEGVLN